MGKGLRWTSFLVVGIVIGFMGSLLFNSGEEVESTEPPPAVEETANVEIENEPTESVNQDNILAQKGCVSCHAVSPIDEKGNGTAPDLAIAYDDVKKRFGKSLEEFMDAPEGTMSAVFGASPLTEEEKAEVIKVIKEYSEQK